MVLSVECFTFLTIYFPISFKRFAISMAAIAQSYPLFPAFVPARSIACSIVSVVRTPKIAGTPVSLLTEATPLDTSPLTYSKCGVAPRMTEPSVTSASYLFVSASFFVASGFHRHLVPKQLRYHFRLHRDVSKHLRHRLTIFH